MPLKKQTNSMSQSALPSSFRTIIKNRVNNQTIKDIVKLSVALQSNLDQDDKRSVKSSASIKLKNDISNSGTDKLKNFVRNMKTNKKNESIPIAVTIPKNVQNNDLGNSRKSIFSTRSAKSNTQNMFSIHVQKEFQDNKSVVSTKSLANSECLSRSKLLKSSYFEDPNKQKMMDKLNKMEERIDYLVKNKLKSLSLKTKSSARYNPRPFFGSGAFSRSIVQPIQDDGIIEKQFQNLIEAISRLKQKQSDENLSLTELEQNIQELDKKILLLQKILASNSTQAELLRKYYFAQKSQKCAHLNRKDKIIQQISKRKQLLKGNASMIQMRDLNKKKPIIRYESSSKYYFTKPQRSAYVDLKNKSKPYIPNNQPLSRSSYGRQFLNYGTLPVFNYKPHDSKHAISKMHFTTSNYGEAFKAKDIDLKQINYKQLDCFKDKIKTGSISFAQLYKNKGLSKQKENQKISKNKNSHSKQNSIQKAMQTLNSMQNSTFNVSKSKFMGGTEMKRQFIWHLTEKKSPRQDQKQEGKTLAKAAVIKNAQLYNLKNSYRMDFIR